MDPVFAVARRQRRPNAPAGSRHSPMVAAMSQHMTTGRAPVGSNAQGTGPLSRWRMPLPCLVLAACMPACSSGGDDTQGSHLKISLAVNAPPAGATDTAWMEQSQSSSLLEVAVVAHAISSAFDGFDVEIQFDPSVAQATG